MPVGMLWEWDNPKDEERNRKRLEKSKEVNEFFFKIAKERDIKAKSSVWADNTGHIILWSEYENFDEIAKWWLDEEFQILMAEMSLLVDNFNIRWLRPIIPGVDD
jgi:hypothetical protein